MRCWLVILPIERAVLLIVDEFEEVFTHVQDPALRQAFARRLWTLASEPHSASQTTVLITLRVDFIGRCGEASCSMTQVCVLIGLRTMKRIASLSPSPDLSSFVPSSPQPARLVGLAIDPWI